MSLIAIDFDGVIHNEFDVDPGRRMGKPYLGAIDKINAFWNEGHTIVIHTLRGKDPKHVQDWLDYFGISYNEVTNKKPDADVFIDNKGLHHLNWELTHQELIKRGIV